MFLAVDIKTNKTFEDFLMNKKRHKVIINIQQTVILENRFLNTFYFLVIKKSSDTLFSWVSAAVSI